ncbi:hypothetical protein BD769DRAFT_1396182 [Suillus cothurnatus]|nr:hypothetical protein BD769DRAFT_1396182 [Suillus cothurnatus]
MSSLGEGHWMSDANSLVLGAPSDPVSRSGIRSTFLEVAPTISAMNSALSLIHTEPSYVSCVLEVFAQGIKYDNEFLKTYFLLAYISITDAKIMAKNCLNFRPHDAAPFRTYCAQVLIEMLTIAASTGQGSELGLCCNETGHTKQLNLQSSDAISLVFAERKTFLKSLKSYATAFIDDPNKEHLGGYNIQNINGSTTEYIHMLTNMTNANEDVTSIIFTCDNQGRPYRREAILVLLAHRLLRPLANRRDSLLDLFPDDYSTFPEHLLSSICAMLVMVLRTRFPGEIPNKFATQAFINEEGHQLALFRMFRNSTNPQAIELNTWLTTPLGPSGWRHDLTMPRHVDTVSDVLSHYECNGARLPVLGFQHLCMIWRAKLEREILPFKLLANINYVLQFTKEMPDLWCGGVNVIRVSMGDLEPALLILQYYVIKGYLHKIQVQAATEQLELCLRTNLRNLVANVANKLMPFN